jgi:chromosome segregation ATPase
MSEDINEDGRMPATPGEETTGAEGQIRRIHDKLQQLLRQRDLLLKENGKLKEELRQLQQDKTGQVTRLEQLQQQVEILGVTKAAMSEGEKKELEKRLGQYIREIDRCITLLGEG